jgi:hypothetical protein
MTTGAIALSGSVCTPALAFLCESFLYRQTQSVMSKLFPPLDNRILLSVVQLELGD